MAKGKKSFVLYSDQKELFEHLSDEQAGKLIKHIFNYVNDENPTADDPLVDIAFIPIKQHLKRDLKNWEKKQKQRSEAGKKSAESRQRKSTTVNDRQPTSTVNVNVNENVNDNVNENKIKLFDQFWDKYDKKVGRKKALQKWMKLKESDIDKILGVVDDYVKSTPDVKFRKQPLTWLNGEHWNDEIQVKDKKEEREITDYERIMNFRYE